LRNKPFFS